MGSVNTSNVFQPAVGATAVRVTAASLVKYVFETGQRTVRSVAVAKLYDQAGFSLGSSLATLNASHSALLNPIVGGWIGGSLSLSLVSWQGLTTASASVTPRALQTQLVALGLNVGTFDQLMNTDITLFNLYKAYANALTNQGQVAAASVMNTLSLTANGSSHMKLGQLFDFSQGDPGTAMNLAVNAFQFVTGSAAVANGSSFVSVPNVTIAVPNVSNTSLSLQVIEAPIIKFGTVGTKITTAQVQLTVTPTLANVTVANVAPLTSIRLNGALPLTATAGGAVATLNSITCTTPKAVGIGVDPKAYTSASTATVGLTAQVLVVPVTGSATLNSSVTTDAANVPLTFAYPGEFGPPGKHAGGTTLGLSGLPAAGTVTVSLVGVSVPIGLPGAVAGALSPVLGNVDTLIVDPLMRALGLDLGGGDVEALGISCGLFGLAS